MAAQCQRAWESTRPGGERHKMVALRCTGCDQEVPMVVGVPAAIDYCDPCKKCGATERYIQMQNRIKHDTVARKGSVEVTVRNSVSTRTGRMMKVERVVDRELDRYVERIT